MFKKYAGLALAGVFAVNMFNYGPATRTTTSVRVESDTNVNTPTGSPRTGIGERLKTDIKNVIKTDIQNFKGSRATFTGQVTAVGSSTITVNDGGTSVQVDISSNTHFRRKFWGESKLAEISVGDSVQVVGKWTSDAKTEITAVLIRDLSIQKRFGVFFGTVKSLTSGGFVVTTIHRDDETVTFGSAKIINRQGGTLSQGDVKVGDKVRVRGMWDSNLKTITETVEVKDFSLPPRASGEPSPVPTATP